MKKVVFYIFVAMVVLCSFSATALQLLPLAAATLLMGLDIWGKKPMLISISVLSVLMIIINGIALSIVDVVVWLLAAIVFFPRE